MGTTVSKFMGQTAFFNLIREVCPRNCLSVGVRKKRKRGMGDSGEDSSRGETERDTRYPFTEPGAPLPVLTARGSGSGHGNAKLSAKSNRQIHFFFEFG